MTEIVNGYLKTVIYQTNGFFICKFLLEQNTKRYIIVKGYFNNLQPEQLYQLHGKFINHHKYGKQFEVSHYQTLILDDTKYLITYLSSNLFPTIGTKTATKIVENLKTNIIEKIKNDKNVLLKIGISKKQTNIIYNQLHQTTVEDELITTFAQNEIALTTLTKLKSFYGEKLVTILSQPYQILDDNLLSFNKVDQIALALSIPKDNIFRLVYAFEDIIKKNTFQTGNSYVEKNIALRKLQQFDCQWTEQLIKTVIERAVNLKKIIFDNNNFYTAEIYNSEINIASFLHFLNQNSNIIINNINDNINLLEKNNKFAYDQKQKQALINLIKNNLLIISGAAGTGKTTLVKGLIDIYNIYYPKHKIAIAAPTGRAARRLNQQTKHDALTLHKMLKWDINTNTFKHNETNPLDYDLIIIDEMSMVDTILFNNFCKAANNIKKLVLVGDPNQLPSINSGNILYDLLKYQNFNIVKLETIYRQKEDSHIINLSLNVKNGITIDQIENNQSQLQILDIEDDNKILETIINNFQKLLKTNNIFQVQVISPMYDHITGINNLNQVLQNSYNPKNKKKNEIKIGNIIYREQDKVMQTKNQPEQDIYNGDLGVIKKIKKTKDQWLLEVLYEDKTITYSSSNIDELIHAYAISVHKAQGSEYEKVIMVISEKFIHMLQRNLLYTAITRSQDQLFIIGPKKWINYGINKINKPRLTTLLERIKVGSENEIKTIKS